MSEQFRQFRNIVIRVVVFIAVYVIAVLASSRYLNRMTPDMAGTMADSTFPLVYMQQGGISFNCLHGYSREMDVSQMRYSITQYSVFGTDPDGKPRYDLSDGKEVGRTHSPVSTSLSACYRRLWLRDGHWTVYSAIALGLVHTPDKGPGPHVNVMPGFAPLGMRYGWQNLYACVELGFTPAASLIAAGIGWKF